MLERFLTLSPGFFTPDGERLNKFAYAFLIVLCLAFFTPGLATLPPTDRDESLFAQASKQMIESGNYVDIRFQDQPRYKKPIGIYWLQAASVKLLNPHHLDEIWAYRVPSLIGATVAVLMTACLGAFLFSPAAGLLGAIMMAGCLILNVEARLAKTDAALLGSIMVAQYALARAYIGYQSAKIVTLGRLLRVLDGAWRRHSDQRADYFADRSLNPPMAADHGKKSQMVRRAQTRLSASYMFCC